MDRISGSDLQKPENAQGKQFGSSETLKTHIIYICVGVIMSIPANIKTKKPINYSTIEIQEQLDLEIEALELFFPTWDLGYTPTLDRKFCKVPSDVREGQDSSLFNPNKISIGPYHHRDCLPGDVEKNTYVACFLNRVNKKFQDFLVDLAKEKDALWEKFDGLDQIFWGNNKKDDFVQMMVFDGCYLLEMMLRAAKDGEFDLSSDSNEMKTKKLDMLLFENQIPIEVLVVLLESARVDYTLQDLIRNFFRLPPALLVSSGLHILDWYRVSLLTGELDYHHCIAAFDHYGINKILGRICSLNFLSRQSEREKKVFKASEFYIPSVAELEGAKIGITTSATSSLMDISVTRTTLRLPQIYVDTTTKSIFYNLIMFERINSDAKDMRFSSYIYFMNRLLRKSEDCRILRMHSIIRTTLDKDKVFQLFAGLSKKIKFSDNVPMDAKLFSTGEQLRERYSKNMQPWRKELLGKYLSSPWAVISIIVALSIFALTIVQTVYTILGYFNRL